MNWHVYYFELRTPKWSLDSPLSSLNGQGQPGKFQVFWGQTHAWLHMVYPDCTADLLQVGALESLLKKKKKKFRSEAVLWLCSRVVQLLFPNLPYGSTVIFQVRIPKQLHLQASFSVPFRRDRIAAAYQIQATDSASCVRLAQMVEYQEWNVYKQRREEGNSVFLCIPSSQELND